MSKNPILSHIRSFVRRQGRLTLAQAHALSAYHDDFMLEAEGLWSFDKTFPDSQAVVLEIGFGNGETLVEQAMASPLTGFIGIEVHSPGVGHCMHMSHEKSLTNLRLCQADAFLVLRDCVPSNSLARIQIYFPDPWHKNRHHKRRLIQSPFVDLLVDKLSAAGSIHMATDWEPYAAHALRVFSEHKALCNQSISKGYVAKPDFRPVTKFEKRGHRLGHQSYDLLFQKVS